MLLKRRSSTRKNKQKKDQNANRNAVADPVVLGLYALVQNHLHKAIDHVFVAWTCSDPYLTMVCGGEKAPFTLDSDPRMTPRCVETDTLVQKFKKALCAVIAIGGRRDLQYAHAILLNIIHDPLFSAWQDCSPADQLVLAQAQTLLCQMYLGRHAHQLPPIPMDCIHHWLSDAAVKAAYPEAAYLLAGLLPRILGGLNAQTAKMSLHWYNVAIEKGHLKAKFALSQLLKTGYLCDKDLSPAAAEQRRLKLLQEADEAGCIEARVVWKAHIQSQSLQVPAASNTRTEEKPVAAARKTKPEEKPAIVKAPELSLEEVFCNLLQESNPVKLRHFLSKNKGFSIPPMLWCRVIQTKNNALLTLVLKCRGCQWDEKTVDETSRLFIDAALSTESIEILQIILQNFPKIIVKAVYFSHLPEENALRQVLQAHEKKQQQTASPVVAKVVAFSARSALFAAKQSAEQVAAEQHRSEQESMVVWLDQRIGEGAFFSSDRNFRWDESHMAYPINGR